MTNLSGPSLWTRVFMPFALGYYLSYLLRTVNAVISPALSADLGLTPGQLGVLTSMYFIAFGLMQIPVGIALDRYGPRRVESALLLLTAAGALCFASADSLAALSIGRALIGAGVSACLMGALKGFALWFPLEQRSSLAGYVMACGALGALSASAPLEAMLPLIGWRGSFWAIAVVALVAAVVLFTSLPRQVPQQGDARLGEIICSLGAIFSAPAFLRFCGSSLFFTGGFMALQGLWAIPWLLEVEQLELGAAANILFILNCGMLVGQLLIGIFGVRLVRRGVEPLHMLQLGYGGLLVVETMILFSVGPSGWRWFLFGMLSAVNSQVYLAAASQFPSAMFGRVSTSINLMAFLGAFIVQAGMGLMLDVLQGAGWELAAALQRVFLLLLVAQLLSYLPLFTLRRRARKIHSD